MFLTTTRVVVSHWVSISMRIAAISDIHGNSAALNAVLCDIDKYGVDLIVNLGDHFSGPLDARGTADQLLSLDMINILGNHDRWIAKQDHSMMGPSDYSADSQLEQSHREWLCGLPQTAIVEDVYLCHGTPSSDTTYWMEAVKPDGSVCMADQRHIEHHAVGIDTSVIICGHTHLPRIMRLQDGRLLVNPGSVGCPGYDDVTPVPHVMQTGNPDAQYAVLECVNGRWSVQLRTVQYQTQRMVDMAVANGRLEWASALKTGWVSVN